MQVLLSDTVTHWHDNAALGLPLPGLDDADFIPGRGGVPVALQY